MHISTWVAPPSYTLFKKKRNFNLSIFPGAPGSVTWHRVLMILFAFSNNHQYTRQMNIFHHFTNVVFPFEKNENSPLNCIRRTFSIVGHLHAGNIIVEDNRIKLLDLENWLLGLPSYYRCYITQLKKINVSTALFFSISPIIKPSTIIDHFTMVRQTLWNVPSPC